jgi:hypothetical protein
MPAESWLRRFARSQEAVSVPQAEANNLLRVVDESGDDYLYPARLFRKLSLPSDIKRALRMAS